MADQNFPAPDEDREMTFPDVEAHKTEPATEEPSEIGDDDDPDVEAHATQI
jgi:hypothetical protein